MNSDLKQFVIKYLSIVAGTLMLVGFFAFVTIPYCMGGQPGEVNLAQVSVQAPTQIALDAYQSGIAIQEGTAIKL